MEQLLNGHWISEWGEGDTVLFPREIHDAKQVSELPWHTSPSPNNEAAFFTFRLHPPAQQMAYGRNCILEFALVHLRSKELLDDLPLIGGILYAFEKESDRGKDAGVPRDGFSMSYKAYMHRSYAEAESYFRENLRGINRLLAKTLS